MKNDKENENEKVNGATNDNIVPQVLNVTKSFFSSEKLHPKSHFT